MSSKAPEQDAVVLLSAGLDSSFNLVKALEAFRVRLALTFQYGQKAAVREIDRAGRLAAHYKVPHRVVDLSWFAQFSKTALVGDAQVPQGHEVQIDDINRSMQTAERVWVPNRNGIFLNVAAGFAEGLGASVVIPGFNVEEASTFPDNSQEFLAAMDASLSYSTSGRVRTFCFSTQMVKTEIVREALAAGLDLSILWPCYLNGERWCGTCESCLRFERAVQANGLSFQELRGGAK